MPKFKCDFCKRRSTKAAMQKHEHRCFRNPNRFCDNCENKGFTRNHIIDHYYEDTPCHFCSKRDPKIEEAIKKYEADMNKTVDELTTDNNLPF